jgi:hypothetical protein
VNSGITPNINYIIELDRRGENDAVFYNCANPEFTEFIKRAGFKEETGTFSDISIIAPALKIAAVNISSGFYNEHSKHEYVDFGVIEKNIERISHLITTPAKRFEYIEAVSRYKNYHYPMYFYGDIMDFECEDEAQYLKILKQISRIYGYNSNDIDELLAEGWTVYDIEQLMYDEELLGYKDETQFEIVMENN